MSTIPLSSKLKSEIKLWKIIDLVLNKQIDEQKGIKSKFVCDSCEEEIKEYTQNLREQSKLIVDLIKKEKDSWICCNVKLNWWIDAIDEGKTEESKGNRRITVVDKFIKLTEGKDK